MKRLQLFLVSMAWCVGMLAQQGSDAFFEIGAGTVGRSSLGASVPFSASGVRMNVKAGIGNGYFAAVGYGGYSSAPSERWSACYGIRIRYEKCQFGGSATGYRGSPSSFQNERFEYSSVITMRSVALNLPLAIAARPTTWAEIRLGIETAIAIPFGQSERGTLVTTTDHYTPPPVTYAYTTTNSTEIFRTMEDMPRVQAMFMVTSGYRHRIGRTHFGPDVMYRISDLPAGATKGSPWMFSLWSGWDLRKR